MIPTENGDFCKKCRTEVIDFSQKSDKEIESYFRNRGTEKICARLRPDQVFVPKSSGKKTKMRTLRRIAAAIILAISGGVNNPTLAGGISWSMDDVMYESVQWGQGSPLISGSGQPGFHIPDASPVLKVESLPPFATEVDENSEMIEPHRELDGKIESLQEEIIEEHIHQPLIIEPIQDELIEKEEEPINERQIVPAIEPIPELSVFPNPTKGPVNIQFKLNVHSTIQIDIYDLSGKMVKEILSAGDHEEGLFLLQTDLGDLPDGIYHCTLRSETQKVSRKVVVSR